MDKISLLRLIYEFINVKYPMGYTTFKKEGGDFLVDPLIDNQILIYHPDFPKNLMDDLSCIPYLSFKYLNSTNFEGLSTEEIIEYIWDATGKLEKQYGIENIVHEINNRIAIFISIKDKGLSNKTIESISHTLLSLIPKLKRGYIMYENEIFPFGEFDTKNNNIVEHKASSPNVEKRLRETSINHDDVLNTIIAVNQEEDVLDIINKL
jgi:hypothetical protein